MQVRSGVEPRHQDDDVRFRTFYYFRVFDACFRIEDSAGDYNVHVAADGTSTPLKSDHPFRIKTKGAYHILSDSLYRFRMTGKANPLFTAVHFEAGTLKASEIDPFGANVEFDSEGRRFRYVSAAETAKRAEQRAIYKELRALDAYAASLIDDPNAPQAKKDAVNQQRQGINARIAALWARLTALDTGFSAASAPATQSTSPACPATAVNRRGYQVLGPEGFRTFDQDERLLLAMSISGKPLISALKELSNRVLNERGSSSATLLGLAQERVRIAEARRTLDLLRDDTSKTPEQIAAEVQAAFSPREVGQ